MPKSNLEDYLKTPKILHKAGITQSKVIRVEFKFQKPNTSNYYQETPFSKQLINFLYQYSLCAEVGRFGYTDVYYVGICWDYTPVKYIAIIINRLRNFFAVGAKMNLKFFYQKFFLELTELNEVKFDKCVIDKKRYVFFKFK